MFLTCRAVLGAGRMTVPDHGAARRAPVSYSPRYSQSWYKNISSSGQSLALYLTDFWGLQPALPLLVHFSGISTASLSGRELIRRFETLSAPSPGLVASPRARSSTFQGLVGSLAGISWMAWVLSPLTFPDPAAVNIHVVDAGLH